MKSAKTQSQKQAKNLRPKHKHTKEYLKHYYPFIPMFVSIMFLMLVLFNPWQTKKHDVLGLAINIAPQSLLDATNNQRQKSGVKNLAINPLLQQAAQNKAQDMVNRNYWSHKTPEGKDPWQFIANEGYSYQKAGENLAYGFDDSSSVVTGWMNSTTHRRNLLDKDFAEVGFGIANSNNFNTGGATTVVVAMYTQPLPVGSVSSTNSDSAGTLGESKTISSANIYTKSSWAIYIVGAIIGMAVMYLAGVHGNNLKKTIKKGEKFIIRHPLLDSGVICLIALGIILLRTAGQIL